MQILDLFAGRAFRMGKASNWRIVHPEMGARHLGLDYIRLPEHQDLSHTATSAEEVFVVIDGSATVQANSERRPLARLPCASSATLGSRSLLEGPSRGR